MKNLLFPPFLALLLFGVSCKEDDIPTAQESVTIMLTAGTSGWEEPVVTVDGVDHSDLYKDFSIKFDKNTYASTSGAPVWKASGTWEFINEEATLMKIDKDLQIEINSISNDFLELSFQWDQDTFEPGRTASVSGRQKFKLKRK